MSLAYIEHSKIDFQKWDSTISKSVNGIVYAYSWYLDIVSPGWDAIINDDYETVMPVTITRKAGSKFFVQPLLTQQSGVFSGKLISPEIVEEFLVFAQQHFRYININLNKYNKINAQKFTVKEYQTYELDLIQPYLKLYQKYSTNAKRNLRKAIDNRLSIVNSVTPNQLIDLIKNNLGEKVPELKEHQYNNIRKILSFSLQHGISEIIGAYTDKNELCSAGFFLSANNKSIYLFGGSDETGKENSAMFLIMDYFIKKNAEKNVILDFEGSNYPGLARFYAGYGALPSKYFNFKVNNLPWYLKPFKS